MTPSSHDRSAIVFTPRLLLGLGVALFGAVLMLDRLGIANADSVLRLWPLILIAIGVQQFFNPRESRIRRGVPVNGIVMMAIGGVLLLNSFGVLRVSIWELFWPAVLIALGVRLMTRPGIQSRIGAGASAPDASAPSSDIGAVFAVLSGVKRVSAPLPFHGAEVTTFMGGALVDLRPALLEPGAEAGTRHLRGDGRVRTADSAPLDRLRTARGGDGRRGRQAHRGVANRHRAGRGAGGAAPRLVIRGFVMMGGVTIRS